jgi:catechol 2,3-dioxygenase-like lactoylglutathione lyase family enzyme
LITSHIDEKEGIMKRALLFWAAVSLCFIAFDLQAEEAAPATRIDRIFVISDNAQEPANPLLGTGLGVDHIGIAVRDLKKTEKDYEQVLGFKFMEIPPQPDGVVPYVIYFENTSYLELQPIAALPFIAKMFDYADGYADFGEKYEGAVFLGLGTSSAKDAADYLKAHNFQASLVGEDPGLNYVMISHEPSGKKEAFPLAIFLVEYVSPERVARLSGMREKGMMAHPNTAKRLHSVWFAVRDLEASLRRLQDADLEPGQTHEAKFLGAQGREVKAGRGSMLVLESADKNSVLNKFLSDHYDGSIIAVSIEVSDLNNAQAWIGSHSGHKLEPYDGFYGRSILIPPDLTHGVWMELYQR